MSVTFHDAFCGAGGTTDGAIRAGARPVLGLNHWKVACESYGHNHAPAGADVYCADVVTIDPRRLPPAMMLLASPECTHHSYARGRPKDDPSLFDPDGDQAAERSRATMWDVPRFAEHHDYRAIIVENVEQAVKWGLPKRAKLAHGAYGPLFAAWLNAMAALGYEHELVHLNAMTCAIPQSRDRLFCVFWKRGQRKPDLEINALGFCFACERLVEGRQRWKRPGATTGSYGPQYFYACPDCQAPVALAVRPAAAAIDWSLPNPRIGDRDRPLAPATLERIRRGLDRLGERPMVMPVTHADTSARARPLSIPLPTQTAYQEQALVVQVGGNLGRKLADGSIDRAALEKSWPADEPFRTIHGSADRALVVSNMNNNVPRLAAEEAMAAVTTGDKLYLLDAPESIVIRGGGDGAPRIAGAEAMPTQTTINSLYLLDTARRNSRTQPVDETTIPTIVADGTHHALVMASYGSGPGRDYQGHARDPDREVLGSLTTRENHSLFTYRQGPGLRDPRRPIPTLATFEQHAVVEHPGEIAVEDCGFRMLQPHELKRGQDFSDDYFLFGNKREQVAQVGNAVPGGMEQVLVERVIESLEPVGS